MSDTEQENKEQNNNQVLKNSDFIPLNDLVYAPLNALAKSNENLHTSIIEAIKKMGNIEKVNNEEVINLKSINVAYEQVREENDGDYNVEKLQMKLPIISILPLTSLNIEKAEINFSTEIKIDKKDKENFEIFARICSPDQRECDFLPRVTYKMKINSLSTSEGLMRLIDLLDVNQIVKKVDTTPISIDGGFIKGSDKNIYNEISILKRKVKKLQKLYNKITDMIKEQENMEQILNDGSSKFDKDKYLNIQSDIINKIKKYKELIIEKELSIDFDIE